MWYYEDKEVQDIEPKYVAFVYEIENLTNGKKYIGKKRLQFLKTKQVKGKKKKIKIESDWRDYYGSSDTLKEDIEKLGKENFRRKILYLCSSLSEASYLELREQIDKRVLESDGWYNEWIMVRVRKPQLKSLKKVDKEA